MDETLILKNGGWYMAVRPDRGANIEELRYNAQAVYQKGDWEQEPFFQGAAILLPANRTKSGRFSFEGKEYRLPVNEEGRDAHLHGFVYRQAFSVTERSDSAVTMIYENHGEIYPFPFRLEVTYRLEEDGAVQEYRLTAAERMPYIFGLHTAFALPADFQAPLAECLEKDADHIPTGRYVPLNEEERLYVAGCSPAGRVISGYYRSSGSEARVGPFCYAVSEGFDHWILFNARGERDFLCVEPQAGAVNGLNNGRFCLLEAGETAVYRTKISVIK